MLVHFTPAWCQRDGPPSCVDRTASCSDIEVQAMLAQVSFQWEESAHTWQVEENSLHTPLVDSELIELVGHCIECCLARCSVFGRPSPLGSTLLKLRDSSSSHRGADVCIITTDSGRELAHAAILRARAPVLWSQMVSRATKSGEWLCVKPKYGGNVKLNLK